jgi:hypothetical protein
VAPASSNLNLAFDIKPFDSAPPGIVVKSGQLHLRNLVAVSDRSSMATRAQLDSIDLTLGAANASMLADAPPGLYSEITFEGPVPGHMVDLHGTSDGHSLEASASLGPQQVTCRDPASLAPGSMVQLHLSVDPTHWFDGVNIPVAQPPEYEVEIEDSPQFKANIAASFALDCTAQ